MTWAKHLVAVGLAVAVANFPLLPGYAGITGSPLQATPDPVAEAQKTVLVLRHATPLSDVVEALGAADQTPVVLHHRHPEQGGFFSRDWPLDKIHRVYANTFREAYPDAGEPEIIALQVRGTTAANGNSILPASSSAVVPLAMPVAVFPSRDAAEQIVPLPSAAPQEPAAASESATETVPEDPQWMPDHGILNAEDLGSGELPRMIFQQLTWMSETGLGEFEAPILVASAYEHNLQLFNEENFDLLPGAGSRPICPPNQGGRFWGTNDSAMWGHSFPEAAGFYTDFTASDECTVMDFTFGLLYPQRLTVETDYSVLIRAASGEGGLASSPFALRGEKLTRDCAAAPEDSWCTGSIGFLPTDSHPLSPSTDPRDGQVLIPRAAGCALPGNYAWVHGENTSCLPEGGIASGSTVRISHDRSGLPSSEPDISATGRYVAFASASEGLVPEDSNAVRDVFLYDSSVGSISRVSVSSDGSQGNEMSFSPAISADGRYIIFVSLANNLVPGLARYHQPRLLYVHDRLRGTTELVSRKAVTREPATLHGGRAAISADGRYVAFSSSQVHAPCCGINNGDIFLVDRQSGSSTRVSAVPGTGGLLGGNGWSWDPSLSADGSQVAFLSTSSNLVPNDTNRDQDVFVYDRDRDTIDRVSVTSQGAQANGRSEWATISADGRYVVFSTLAPNLTGDWTGAVGQVMIHDRRTSTTSLVSVDYLGQPAASGGSAGTISPDGRYVAFISGPDLVGPSDYGGRNDVYVRDLVQATTLRVTAGVSGDGANRPNGGRPVVSADGGVVAFSSQASNLVADDSNGVEDVFVYRR